MNIYEQTINRWGNEKQILMMLEEMSELSFLLFKKLRNEKDKTPDNWQISEEMADVELMLEQMRYIFNNSDEIMEMKLTKIKRLQERLGYIAVPEGIRFFCKYDGKHFLKCACNDDGLCRTVYKEYPEHLIHPFDGKNIIKCLCG